MCDRLACYLNKDELISSCTDDDGVKYYSKSFYHFCPSYNVSPNTPVPVLVDKKIALDDDVDLDSDIKRLLIPMKWGFDFLKIPPDKDGLSNEDAASPTHIANLNSILESELYSSVMKKNYRCLVICNGYFEWQNISGDKQPFYIYHEDRTQISNILYKEPLLKLAAIFNKQYNEATRQFKFSCSIISKESDSHLSWLNSRMPIPLNLEEDVSRWIDNDKLTCQESYEYLKSFDEVKGDEIAVSKFHVKYHAVNKALISNISDASEWCISKIVLKRKNPLETWLNPKHVKKY